MGNCLRRRLFLTLSPSADNTTTLEWLSYPRVVLPKSAASMYILTSNKSARQRYKNHKFSG